MTLFASNIKILLFFLCTHQSAVEFRSAHSMVQIFGWLSTFLYLVWHKHVKWLARFSCVLIGLLEDNKRKFYSLTRVLAHSSRNYWLTGCVAFKQSRREVNCGMKLLLFQCSETHCSSKTCERLIWTAEIFRGCVVSYGSCSKNKFLVSKETVLLRRWESKHKTDLPLSNELIKVELPPW